MKTLRTFICIDFPSEVIKEIERLQSLIAKKPFTGKLTEPENLHLTLKFLGEIDSGVLNKIKQQLSKISFPKFQAKLQEAGTFSYNKRPKIVWIKVGSAAQSGVGNFAPPILEGGRGMVEESLGRQNVFNLQKTIDDSLSSLFSKEQRFMSHLTIARIKYVKDKQAFTDYIKNLSVKPISFPITEFKLMSSELKPMGPVYETIEEYKLS